MTRIFQLKCSRLRKLFTICAFAFGFFFTFALQTALSQTTSGVQAQETFRGTDVEYFENKIRPILIEHCLECHGDDPKKLRGGLRLTSRAEMMTGGDSGPAIVPGKPNESLLVSSIHYEDFEMPPKGQLAADQIQAIEKWIELGAPDPRKTSGTPATQEIDIEAGKTFWAFTPLKTSRPVEVEGESWPETEIDRYLINAMRKKGIRPVADTNRERLIRRAYITLIGLPPTIEQTDNFVGAPAPTPIAFSKVIDRLLDLPQFGERWGRHWLDVVRFAESSGGGRSLMFPHAWRFRDYVIDSFNDDKPFDQFVREQIAGDLLDFQSLEQKNQQIVATGMLTLGPTNYEQQDKELLRMEVIDEQVDTIGRAFLGLTLGCARCHDHKFDPIPMTDYYAMAGILGSTQTLVDGNVSSYVTHPLADAETVAASTAYQEMVKTLADELEQLKKSNANTSKASEIVKTKSHSSHDLRGLVIDDSQAEKIGDWQDSVFTKYFVDGNYLHDQNKNKSKIKVVFSPKFETGGNYEVRIAYPAGGNRASNTPVTIEHQDGRETVLVNQTKHPPIDELFVSLGVFRFEADNQASVTISTENTDGHVIVDAVQFLLQPDDFKDPKSVKKPLKQSSFKNRPSQAVNQDVAPPPSTTKLSLAKTKIAALDARLRKLKQNGPPKIETAMSVKDAKQPCDGHLHIRGSVRNLGPVVPRGFISVCSQKSPRPQLSENESGRLQLADWIADPKHPLTARVYVNRVWRQLFGTGLVRTVDNFGFVGEKPINPKLLDFLAKQFVENGWSTKTLIRQIMVSHVFRLSSTTDAKAIKIDPENRLHWRFNRRRVDAEVLRDSLLFVSGDLDATPGGLTIRKLSQYDLGYQFDTVRRSVYVPAFRNSMLDLFEAFDFANPNLVVGDRNTSTLPTQALFLMNNPMVIEQSRKTAKRLMTKVEDDEQRVVVAFREALGRSPNKEETKKALAYIQEIKATAESSSKDADSKAPEHAAWSSFCHALFASLDFRYIE